MIQVSRIYVNCIEVLLFNKSVEHPTSHVILGRQKTNHKNSAVGR